MISSVISLSRYSETRTTRRCLMSSLRWTRLISNRTEKSQPPNVLGSEEITYIPILVSVVHGKLTESAFPWVGISTFKRCPRVGNLTWPPSWKSERNWK